MTIRSHTRRRLLWFTAVACLLFGYVWIDSVLSTPLSKPISLRESGSFSRDFWLPIQERYDLLLEFKRGEEPFEHLQQLIGESPDSGGTVVPLKWSIVDTSSGLVAAHAEVASRGAYGWSTDAVSRHLGNIELPAGNYTLNIQVLQAAPDLALLYPKIVLEVNPKFTTSWQMGLMFWVSMLVLPIGAFVLLIIALQLLWTAGRHLTSHSTQDAQKARAG